MPISELLTLGVVRQSTQPGRNVNTLCEVGCIASLCRFENGSGWQAACSTGGRPDQGCCDEQSIVIDIQPPDGEKIVCEIDGIHVEAEYKFYYEPKDGLYLRTADSRFVIGAYDASVNNGYGDLIFWLGEYWLISAIRNWTDPGCDDTPCTEVVLQEGMMIRWRNCWQERTATQASDPSPINIADEWELAPG